MSTAGRARSRLAPLALIAAGGFLGAVLRHALALSLPGRLPWGTLAANVGGAFLLGLLLYEAHLADRLGPETRLLVGTGFCSSLTTYSTFAVETSRLTVEFAAANVLLNYALGFAAIGLSRAVARWLS